MKISRTQLWAALAGIKVLRRPAAERKPQRPPATHKRRLFHIALPAGPILAVMACTGSEARALVKKQLGLKPRERLPVGAHVLSPFKLSKAA